MAGLTIPGTDITIPLPGDDSGTDATQAAPQPPALTIADVLAELPDGWTIDSVVLHDSTGKAITDRAPAPTTPLQPGMAIQIKGNNGQVALTHVNGDASDIDPWTTTSKAANPPETPEKAAAKTTATTTARIQAEIANPKTMVRGTPRTGMEVSDDGGKTWHPAAQTGNSPVEQAIAQVTDDPRVQLAMKVGAAMEGGLGPTYGAGDGGMSWGPFQINHNSGMHADISRADSEDPVKAAQYMLSEYQAAVQQVPADMWTSNPKQAAALAAFYAERPAQMYPQDRIDAAWSAVSGGGAGGPYPSGGLVSKQHVNIGGKEYVFDPVSGQMIDTGLGFTKPEIQKVNGQSYVYDPTTGGYKVAQGLPTDQLAQLQIQKAKQDLLSKSQLALSQQYDTMNYLRQALAAGAISPSDASAYYGLVKQQTAAQLAGTTAFGIYKQQQDFEAQQATNAKSLLDTQVTASDSLVKTLLNELAPSSKVPPLVASTVPFDINSVLGVAQGNIERYIPAGLTQSAQQLLGQFYGPQPTAPGSVDANGNPTSNMPLSPQDLAGLGIGGDQGNQPAPASPPPDQTTDNTPSDQIVNLKAA